jgi:hypothetical protein
LEVLVIPAIVIETSTLFSDEIQMPILLIRSYGFSVHIIVDIHLLLLGGSFMLQGTSCPGFITSVRPPSQGLWITPVRRQSAATLHPKPRFRLETNYRP